MICDHSQIEEAEVIVQIDSEQHTLLEGGSYVRVIQVLIQKSGFAYT